MARCCNRLMPVEFLSDDQARRYGRYQGDPNPDQLERFFTFGNTELTDISRQRSDANRLGYAVQLGTVRFLGCFVDLHEVPGSVVHHVAADLGIDGEVFRAYSRSSSRFPHAVTIRRRYGTSTRRTAAAKKLNWARSALSSTLRTSSVPPPKLAT
jgi:hypothetical protein